jgi:subfamily B ATP-binding cassette protein MsbA
MKLLVHSIIHVAGARLYFFIPIALSATLVESWALISLIPLLNLILNPEYSAEGSGGGIFDFSTSLHIYLFPQLSFPQFAIALFITLFIIKSCLVVAQYFLMASIKSRANDFMRRGICSILENEKLEKLARLNPGYIANTSSEQITRAILFIESVCSLAVGFFSFTAYFAFALYVSFEVTLVASIFGLVPIFLFRKISQLVNVAADKRNDASNGFVSSILPLANSPKYFRATGNIKDWIGKAHGFSRTVAETEGKCTYLNGILAAVRDPAALLIAVSAGIVSNNFFDINVTITAVVLAILFRAGMAALMVQAYWSGTLVWRSSFSQVSNFIKFKALDNNDVLDDKFDYTLTKDSSIQLNNVTHYVNQEEQLILKEIDLNIKFGECVGLVGGSGSGKTTILDLIAGLVSPAKGTVKVFGVNPVVLSNDARKKVIGYADQNPVIYEGTILSNLWDMDVGRDAVNIEACEDITKQLMLEQLVSDRELGLNSYVDQDGKSLSGGQCQRLALAREILRRPKLLLLDEVTSALDSTTERAVNNIVASLKGTTTIVLVTHKEEILKQCDRVLLIEDGMIFETK